MKSSFRLRLALLSALLSGLVLTAFGATAWWLIRASRIERLDREVRDQAERESQRTRTAADWQRVVSSIASEAGIQDNRYLLFLVEDSAGIPVYQSPSWPASLDVDQFPWPAQTRPGRQPQPAPDRREDPAPARPPESLTVSFQSIGHHWRIGLAATDQSRIAVGIDTAAVDAEMKGILTAFLISLPLCLVLIGVGGWTISSRALLPVRKLTATARRVTAEGLSQRIPAQGEDREFLELIEVFNRMLERLERSFQQARCFSADAAHELKTPLAILQGQIERAIQNADDGSAAQAELSNILDEVRRLSSISGKLLLLSQADAGSLRVNPEPLDLSRLLSELVEDAAMLAPQLLVTGEIQAGLTVKADGALLPQVLHNLISNAIKYNVENGWIRISTATLPDQTVIKIANSSHGIAPTDSERIFDRFFRANSARHRNADGVGLGLSVSREIARAHGGDLLLEISASDAAVFSLVVPQ
jgi:two-component system, OmpR family, heavy metal sensor histidine kinase CusS